MNLSIPLIRAQPEQEKAQKLKTTMNYTDDTFHKTGDLKGVFNYTDYLISPSLF